MGGGGGGVRVGQSGYSKQNFFFSPDLRLVKYCFLCVNNAGQSNSICTMSSVSKPQHLQV